MIGKNKRRLFWFVFALSFCPLVLTAGKFAPVSKNVPESAKNGLVYMWLFDEGIAGHELSTIYDTDNYWLSDYKSNFYQDTFKGNLEYVKGLQATAMKFDGFTTRIIRTAVKVPDLSAAFTIEGWIAPRKTNRAVIFCQEKDYKRGFIFGLFDGCLAIQLSVGGKWVQCKSDEEVTLLQWSHVAVTFKGGDGLDLYLNGEKVGELNVSDFMDAARTEDLLIGMSKKKDLVSMAQAEGFFISGFRLGQTPLSTEHRPVYTRMAYDGLMDEFKLYNRALSREDIEDLFEECEPEEKQPLKSRRYSTGPEVSARRFGASYGRIPYYKEYEDILRIGDYPDILVRFDLLPVKLMFVHSNTYIPTWVTENGKMMGDQGVEINGINGWYEVMMDKQNRYSHVRLLENSPARVVVHWRYALCDRFYQVARPDELTDWGDWVDEYYTIYPDGVAARHWVYWTSSFGKMYLQFQESIIKRQPGQRPEDVLQVEALTLANMQGQTHTYSWEKGLPAYFPKPDGANIQMINMKSKYKPFIVFEPGGRIDKYIWGSRRGSTYLPGGPVTSGIPVISKGRERDSYEAVALYGMSDKPVSELLCLAKSWIKPPKLELISSGYKNKGYDKFQRAYILSCNNSEKISELKLQLDGTRESPVVNPAFVISNWGSRDADLQVNGKKLKRGRDFRVGFRNSMRGVDLVVWIQFQSQKQVQLCFLGVN